MTSKLKCGTAWKLRMLVVVTEDRAGHRQQRVGAFAVGHGSTRRGLRRWRIKKLGDLVHYGRNYRSSETAAQYPGVYIA